MTVQGGSGKKRSKKSGFLGTWIALAIVAGAGAYAYFVEYEGGKKKDEQKQKDAIALRFEAEKAKRIEIVSKARTIVLEKEKDVWRLTDPVNDLADAASVNNLLSTLASEKAIETVAEGDDAQLEKYGLNDPTGKISVLIGDGGSASASPGAAEKKSGADQSPEKKAEQSTGKTLEIRIGAKSFDSNLYAQVGSEKKVILVTSMWDMNLAKQPKDLRDKRLLRTDSTADFDSISVSLGGKDGGKSGKTVLKKAEGKWVFVEPKGAAFPASPDSAQAFLDQIKSLRVQEFPSEDKSDAAVLKRVGLASPGLTIELKAGDKEPWRLKVALPSGGKSKPSDGGALLAATSSDVPALTQISKSGVDGLTKTAEDFFDRRAPFQFEPGMAKQASITTGQQTVVAKKSGDAWTLENPEQAAANGKELDSAKVADLAAKLSALRVDRFLKGEKPKGLQPPRNRIVFKDEKGEPLIDFAWGESFKVSDASASAPSHDEFHASSPPKAEKQEYFAEARVRGGSAFPPFGVLTADIEGLPTKGLLKDKPAPAGAKATTPAVPGAATSAPQAPANSAAPAGGAKTEEKKP